MKRDIVKIDKEKCDGCGLCIPNCHEGALQLIDGKATLVSDLMCDGLGACIGHCPQGAITVEKQEARPYDEVAVIKEIIPQGKNVLIAHLLHLKEHNELNFLNQAIEFLKENVNENQFDINEILNKINFMEEKHEMGCGCPGAQEKSFEPLNQNISFAGDATELKSELSQWPVQMHLINPAASYFKNSDVLLVADCVAYSIGNFHQKYLRGKSLAIACPKLDSDRDVYVEKLVDLIDNAKINTMTVIIMEVPCCSGLSAMAEIALKKANRKVPVKKIIVGIQGEILSEEWM